MNLTWTWGPSSRESMFDVVCRVMEVMGDAGVDADEGCSTQTDRNAFNKHKKKKNLCLLDW
jgi:hypothetical protein